MEVLLTTGAALKIIIYGMAQTALTIHVQVVTAYLPAQSGKPNLHHGVVTMQPGLLPQRLNCPWRVIDEATMLLSPM